MEAEKTNRARAMLMDLGNQVAAMLHKSGREFDALVVVATLEEMLAYMHLAVVELRIAAEEKVQADMLAMIPDSLRERLEAAGVMAPVPVPTEPEPEREVEFPGMYL